MTEHLPGAGVIFHRLGPYHFARLAAAARAVPNLLAVELSARTSSYAWDPVCGAANFKRLTLFEEGDSRRVPPCEVVRRVESILAAHRPQVIAIPGWADQGALAALHWCVAHRTPAVVMSESTVWDERRRWWKEEIKRRPVGLCSAALVGGAPHADYMTALGMPRDRIFLGYDAVDNEYFARNAAEVRSQEAEVRIKYGLPERYFLASARFIEKKNLPRLLQAYARYRAMAGNAESGKRKAGIWDLVLLGDGPLKPLILSQLSTLNLQSSVHLPGFKQYPDLPAYYALAGAFIHASTIEQWGLVVNEAMASGLPVLVSNRCGCASDLVRDGVNGFTFDPFNVEAIAALMLRLSTMPDDQLSAFGNASRKIIARWGPDRFASGLKAAVDKALELGPIKPSLTQMALLKMLLRR